MKATDRQLALALRWHTRTATTATTPHRRRRRHQRRRGQNCHNLRVLRACVRAYERTNERRYSHIFAHTNARARATCREKIQSMCACGDGDGHDGCAGALLLTGWRRRQQQRTRMRCACVYGAHVCALCVVRSSLGRSPQSCARNFVERCAHAYRKHIYCALCCCTVLVCYYVCYSSSRCV